MNYNDNGELLRAQVVTAIQRYGGKFKDNLDQITFACSVNDDTYEEILSYNEILQYI